MVKDYEKILYNQLDDLQESMKNLMIKNSRERSDLQIKSDKQFSRIDNFEKIIEDFKEGMESLCTIILCLTESQSMQIRSEEQDDIDKKNICLLGKRDASDPKGEVKKEEIMKKINGKYPGFPEKVGTKEN